MAGPADRLAVLGRCLSTALDSEPDPGRFARRIGPFLFGLAVLAHLSLAFNFGAVRTWNTDLMLDYWSTRAAWDGTGAYRTMGELGETYGAPGGTSESVHPRTPGALVLQAPLIVARDGPHATLLGLTVAVLTLAGLVLALGVHLQLPMWISALWLLSFVAAQGVWSTYRAGAVGSMIMGASIVAVPILINRGYRLLAGASLAVATALKLIPVLLAPLLFLYPVALGSVIVAWLALSLGGLALPGVTFEGTWASIFGAGGQWFSHPWNPSFGRILHDVAPLSAAGAILSGGVLAVGGIAAFGWLAWRGAALLPVWIGAAALMAGAPPYSWGHYDVASLAALLVLHAAFRERWIWIAYFAFLIVFRWGPDLVGLEGYQGLALSRMAVAGVMFHVALRSLSGSSRGAQ